MLWMSIHNGIYIFLHIVESVNAVLHSTHTLRHFAKFPSQALQTSLPFYQPLEDNVAMICVNQFVFFECLGSGPYWLKLIAIPNIRVSICTGSNLLISCLCFRHQKCPIRPWDVFITWSMMPVKIWRKASCCVLFWITCLIYNLTEFICI